MTVAAAAPTRGATTSMNADTARGAIGAGSDTAPSGQGSRAGTADPPARVDWPPRRAASSVAAAALVSCPGRARHPQRIKPRRPIGAEGWNAEASSCAKSQDPGWQKAFSQEVDPATSRRMTDLLWLRRSARRPAVSFQALLRRAEEAVQSSAAMDADRAGRTRAPDAWLVPAGPARDGSPKRKKATGRWPFRSDGRMRRPARAASTIRDGLASRSRRIRIRRSASHRSRARSGRPAAGCSPAGNWTRTGWWRAGCD